MIPQQWTFETSDDHLQEAAESVVKIKSQVLIISEFFFNDHVLYSIEAICLRLLAFFYAVAEHYSHWTLIDGILMEIELNICGWD